MNITYERDGIKMVFDENGVTLKKNGLTIEIPTWIVEDFVSEFELESNKIMEVIHGESQDNLGRT